MQNEIWKQIIPYPMYSVSNYGRIRNDFTGRILKISVDRYGFHYVRLQVMKLNDTFKVHRLVAHYFISNPKDYECVRHRDGDKSNNRYDNLYWISCSEISTQSQAKKRKTSNGIYLR